MMISEALIRSKSAAIFDAYRQMTGHDAEVSIGDFLSVRQAAVLEISNGITDVVGNTTCAAEIIKNARERQTPFIEKTPQVQDINNGKPKEKVLPQGKEMAPDIPVLPDELQEESDFDILRKAKDPWNE